VPSHVPEKHPSLAKGREHARDVQVRADEDLRWGILQTDICEQEQCQKPSMATVDVHPPLAIHIVAAVNMPARIPRILQTGEAHWNASSHTLSSNPTVRSEKRVVHLPERK
jgi:hypothetical protein